MFSSWPSALPKSPHRASSKSAFTMAPRAARKALLAVAALCSLSHPHLASARPAAVGAVAIAPLNATFTLAVHSSSSSCDLSNGDIIVEAEYKSATRGAGATTGAPCVLARVLVLAPTHGWRMRACCCERAGGVDWCCPRASGCRRDGSWAPVGSPQGVHWGRCQGGAFSQNRISRLLGALSWVEIWTISHVFLPIVYSKNLTSLESPAGTLNP